MTWRSDSAQLISGRWVSSAYAGHGILGSVMRSTTGTGTNGPGILYNDWDSTADDSREFRAQILSGAPSGAQFYEDGSFSIPAGTADGTYSVTYELYVDGVDLGPATASITIGAAGTSPVGASLVTTYSIAAAVGVSLSSAYSISQAVGVSLPTAYAIDAAPGVTPVGVSLVSTWDVYRAVGASLATSYEIEGSEDVPTNLIVEDGSGKPDAESYASVATADLYHSQRRNLAWAGYGIAVKEAALRQATEWLDAEFAGLWQGQRTTSTQALAWPRTGVCIDGVPVAANALPVSLIRATCELALRAATTALTQDVGAQVKSETVGPLSVTYADGARQQTRYAGAEKLVNPLLRSNRNVIRMVRA